MLDRGVLDKPADVFDRDAEWADLAGNWEALRKR